MMIDVLFIYEQLILATTVQMCNVMAAMNLATVHRTAPTRFLPQEHHATKTDLIQAINIATLGGTDHTPPTMVTDMGDNPITIPTVTGAAVSEGACHVPHPTTAAAHAILQPMDASSGIFAVTYSIGIVTPHPTHTTSPADVTHATIPWT